MVALFFLRLLILAVPLWFITTQVVLPLWRGDKAFPIFDKKKKQLVKNAEEELLEAQTAKKAAEIQKEAARLNKEAWEIAEETYNIETGDQETK